MMAGRTAHDMMNQLKKLNKEEVESVDEKLTKSMSAGDIIKDFQDSDAPQFKGKSKEKLRQMALGAFYKMQKEEKYDEDDEGYYAAHATRGVTPAQYKKELEAQKKKKSEKESVKEEVEGDYEYDMARNELATAERAIQRLMEILGQDEGNLEAWVQSKITKACDYLDTVADYMESNSRKTMRESYDPDNTPEYHAGRKLAKERIPNTTGALRGTEPSISKLEGLKSDANLNYPRSSTKIGNPHKEGTEEHKNWHNGYMDQLEDHLDILHNLKKIRNKK